MKGSQQNDPSRPTLRHGRRMVVYGTVRAVVVLCAWLGLTRPLLGDTTNVFSPIVCYQCPDVPAVAPVVGFFRPEAIYLAPTWSCYYQFVLDSVGDGIPDLWRARYFGGYGTTTNDLSCATGDASGTGQNNLFKYIAGLDPTNPASVFVLRTESVSGVSGRQQVIFSPRLPDRNYVPIYKTNLVGGSWQPLNNTSTNDNSTERAVTDLNATNPTKFYRIEISYP